MNETLTDMARAFMDKCRLSNCKGGLEYPYDDIDMENAVIAGVEWQKKQSYTEDQIKQAIFDYCEENGMDDEEAKECVDDFIDNFLNNGCSEKPNNQKTYTDKICGNCDAYCECGLGPDPAKHDDPACPGFDDSVLSQLNKL